MNNLEAWRKSSHSSGKGEECIEVSVKEGKSVSIRDSKNPSGTQIRFNQREWILCISKVKLIE